MRIRLFCLGVGLTSGAAMGLQLLFTRIFSVTLYYHFAFAVISLALLGIAVSGVALSFAPKLAQPERACLWAAVFAIAIAPLAVLALAVAVSNPMSLELHRENWIRLAKLYMATGLPFLASGFAMALAVASAGERIGRVYAFDLGGAALGCLAIIPLTRVLGGPAAVLAVSALAAIGGSLFVLSAPKTQTGYGRGRVVVAGTGLVFSVGVLALAFAQARGGRPFRIAQTAKFLRESGVVFERWNAFSRVTVSKSSAPDHLWLHIDADAATRMFSGSALAAHPEAPRRFSEVKVSSLVYALRRQGPALIIGPGGGPDVLAALYAGVPRVIGVEVNPIIAHDIMRDRYADYSGNLYGDPRVSVHVDDGRSFIRRSGESYSSIQATLVDTWAASAAGAFTLSENNLYTVEAFTEYLDHLAPSGIISMTRWYLSPPREFLRLVALGRAALERRGVSPAELPSHFFIAADARMATLLVRREPFPDRELVLLAAECAQSGLRVLYSPRDGAGSSDALLAGFLGTPDGATFLRSLPYDATPTSDDRPFFFFTMQRRDFWRLLASAGMDRNNLGLNLLQLLLLASVALTLLLVVAPLLIARRDALRADRSQKLRTLGYFLAIGLGFILTEMGLMQRFILFLGHPLYALAIVLASLLAASGAGSALSPRLTRRLGDAQTIRRVVALVVVLLALYAVGLGPLFRLLLPLPLVARALVAIVLVALLGLPMGMLLPSGVKIASAQGAGMVPWAWGLNGATSVLGSILAVALSMQFGFTVTLVVGMGAYLIAGALFRAGTVQGAPRLDSVHVHVESDFSPPVRKPGVAGPR